MTSTTAVKAVDILRSVFSRYGIPDQIVTDNSPQFTAEEFTQFCIGNGIKHTLTAPYHPSTNGEAERFVQTFKTFKTSMQKHNGALQKNLCQFLLHYRSTPHTTTGKTPAEIMFGRNIKTRMDLLHPQSRERHSKQRVKCPLEKLLENWRSEMLSGCEIIEVHPDGFQVPSPPSLVHRTTKSMQMENSTRDTLINYEVVLCKLWKKQSI